MLNPLVGNFGFGNVFLLDKDGIFLTDPSNGRFLLASQSNLPSAPTTDTIAYVFQFTNLAQAQADSVVGPLTIYGLELLVFGDVTVNSVMTESGYWLLLTLKGGVQTQLFFHPNIQLCFDLTTLRVGNSVLGTNIPTAHLCMVADNFGLFIKDGLS